MITVHSDVNSCEQHTGQRIKKMKPHAVLRLHPVIHETNNEIQNLKENAEKWKQSCLTNLGKNDCLSLEKYSFETQSDSGFSDEVMDSSIKNKNCTSSSMEGPVRDAQIQINDNSNSLKPSNISVSNCSIMLGRLDDILEDHRVMPDGSFYLPASKADFESHCQSKIKNEGENDCSSFTKRIKNDISLVNTNDSYNKLNASMFPVVKLKRLKADMLHTYGLSDRTSENNSCMTSPESVYSLASEADFESSCETTNIKHEDESLTLPIMRENEKSIMPVNELDGDAQVQINDNSNSLKSSNISVSNCLIMLDRLDDVLEDHKVIPDESFYLPASKADFESHCKPKIKNEGENYYSSFVKRINNDISSVNINDSYKLNASMLPVVKLERLKSDVLDTYGLPDRASEKSSYITSAKSVHILASEADSEDESLSSSIIRESEESIRPVKVARKSQNNKNVWKSVSNRLQKYSLIVELERLTDEELRYYKFGHSDISVGNEYIESKCEDKNDYALFMRSVRRLFNTLQHGESQLKHMANCSTKRLRPVDVAESVPEIKLKRQRCDTSETAMFDDLCERTAGRHTGCTSSKITSADEIDDLPVFEEETFIQPGESQFKHMTNCSTKRLRPVDVAESVPEIKLKRQRRDTSETSMFDDLCETDTKRHTGSTSSRITCADEIDDLPIFEEEAFIQEKTQEAEKFSKPVGSPVLSFGKEIIQEFENPVNKFEGKTLSCLMGNQNVSVGVDGNLDPSYALKLQNKFLEDDVERLEHEYKKVRSKSKRLKKKNKSLKFVQHEMQQIILKYEEGVMNSQNSSQEVVNKSDHLNYSLELRNKLLEGYVKFLQNTCKKAKSKSKQLRKRNKRLKLVQHKMQQKMLKYEKNAYKRTHYQRCNIIGKRS